MPRTPRVELAGGIHHVTQRGNRKQAIFLDDADRVYYLRELALASRRYKWQCLAYCLMSNHVHLVVETPEKTLGDGMRQLGSRYVAAFNRKHGVPGRMYQGRFWSKLVQSDEQFAQLLRYVALNPVAAGLCATPTGWPWSSHRSLLHAPPDDPARARVESLLGAWGGTRGSRYARLFDGDHPLERKYGPADPWSYRPPLAELLTGAVLDDAMRTARAHGYRISEIAVAAGLTPTTVWRRTQRG